jgi:hypothetical protein
MCTCTYAHKDIHAHVYKHTCTHLSTRGRAPARGKEGTNKVRGDDDGDNDRNVEEGRSKGRDQCKLVKRGQCIKETRSNERQKKTR